MQMQDEDVGLEYRPPLSCDPCPRPKCGASCTANRTIDAYCSHGLKNPMRIHEWDSTPHKELTLRQMLCMKLTSSGSGEEEKQVAGSSAASSSGMHPSRKRHLMTEKQTPLIGPTRVVPAVAPSLIGPVRGFMKARRTRPWLSEAAGATDEEAIAAAHGEKEEPLTEEWSRTPRP